MAATQRASARDKATARAYAVMTKAPIEPAGLAMRDLAALQLTNAERGRLAAFAESHGPALVRDAYSVLDGESWRYKGDKKRAGVCASMRAELDAAASEGDWPFRGTLRASVDRICRSWSAIRRELKHGKREGARRMRITNGDDPTELAAVAKIHADNLEYQYERQKAKGRYSERHDAARLARSERVLRRDDVKKREAGVGAIREKYGSRVATAMRAELLRYDAEKSARAAQSAQSAQSARAARRVPNSVRIPDSPDDE